MAWRGIPSTSALIALASYARHGSVTAAAAELGLTRSAVGYQLRQIEKVTGIPAFKHIRTQALELTPEGRRFAEDARAALGILTEAPARIRPGKTRQLVLVASNGHLASWLTRRLPQFTENHPELEVRLGLLGGAVPEILIDVPADLYLLRGNGEYPHMQSQLLHKVCLRPMLTAELYDTVGGMSTPADIEKVPLIHFRDRGRWREWMVLHGLSPRDADSGALICMDPFTLSSAMLSGGGVILGCSLLGLARAEESIVPRKIVMPFDDAIEATDAHYYLAVPDRLASDTEVIALRDWILDSWITWAETMSMKVEASSPNLDHDR